MPRIPRPVHGVLDYCSAILLAVSPWLFGFKEQHLAPEFALVGGAAIVLVSLFTNYELGLIRLFPFPAHLLFDFVVGILLATNWIHFAFGGKAGVVFTIFGIWSLVVTLFTRHTGPMKTPTAT